MKPSNFLVKFLLRLSPKRSTYPLNLNAGFSLVELAIVVLIIGILSAIAAPSWNAFISRQRIRTVNDGVFRALRSAQSDAKLKKADRIVEFRDINIDSATNPSTGKPYNDPPRFHIYSTSKTTPIPNTDLLWESLGANSEIKPGMVKLAIKECQTKDANDNCTAYQDDPNDQIKFNHLGAVEINDPTQELPFAVTASTTDDGFKRCVIVETILGSMRIAEGEFDSATGAGCP
ncbi:pilus assembly FimT family protein [Dapis sp. BLCC M126]|uniref:pilus assembly FimT family protein n=1 Tax=Dapis sp. BLCC M126 TaxID=3400189 RepID=UPI003CF66F99